MKCDKCGYEWKAIKEDPVSCPRCKRRFDYPEAKEKDSEDNND